MTMLLRTPQIGDAITVNNIGQKIFGFVTGFNKKDGQTIVDYRPGNSPPPKGVLGSHWTRPQDIENITDGRAILNAVDAGYTVHPPICDSDTWAYCINGDYSNEYPDPASAWQAAISDSQQEKAHQQIETSLSRLMRDLGGVVSEKQLEAVKAILSTKPDEISYLLLQEGGSSTEIYLHGHESEEDANNDRINCSSDGAYRTSAPIAVPRWMTHIPGFYETAEILVQSTNGLECVDVPDDWNEEDEDTPSMDGQ